jgi:glycosyltransferase involved in cell wall biosynthesis
MNDLVSVMLVSYNASQTLPWALASLVSQTHPNWECVLVDDGSQDRTHEILDRLKDSRFRIVRHERNRGRGAARQTALDEAKGDYLAFLDADDWLFPTKLERQLEILKLYPNIGLVSTGMAVFDNRNELVGRRGVPVKGGQNYQMLFYKPIAALKLPPICFPTTMIRMSLAKQERFDERLRAGEDRDYLLGLRRRAHIAITSELLYAYRWSPESWQKTHLAMKSNQLLYSKYRHLFPLLSRVQVFEFYAKHLIYWVLYLLHLESVVLNRRNQPHSARDKEEFIQARDIVGLNVGKFLL